MRLSFGPRPESYILPDERRVFRCRPHIVSMLRPTAIAIALIVGLRAVMLVSATAGGQLWLFTSLFWYGQVAVLGWLIYETMRWHDDILMITDKRILRVTGVFTSQLDEMSINKITDRTVRQTAMGLLLHYSYMRLESAGQKQSLEHIPYIPHPHALYEAITKIVVGKSDLPPPVKGGKKFGHWTGSHSTDEISGEWDEESRPES